jgi:Zn-dependent protease/predicted transcriptional regulator
MFGARLTLFTLLGFEIRVDASWLILAVLLTWSLAQGFFPVYYPGLAPEAYWSMGVVGALGLFASIVLHELAHSVVARRYGMPMRGITLFIFGGVAEMEDEPPTAKSEGLMAIAGPIASYALGLAFYLLYLASAGAGLPEALTGVLWYLAFINVVLATFNLIPGFPLDGGRVLRSILWAWKNNLRWATRVASGIGGGFGIALIVLGVFNFIAGNVIGGIWWFVLGLFLWGAAKAHYQQVVVREALRGEPVRRFMKTEPVVVPPSVSLERFVQDYVYAFHYKLYPVVENGRLLGCVTIERLKEEPREEWDWRTVGEIMGGCSPDNTVAPNVDVTKALQLMQKTGSSRLLVAAGDRVVGIVALKDLLNYVSLKAELG